MKFHEILLILLAILFGKLLADYDDDRSPQIQVDWEEIKGIMRTTYTNCYKFVTAMRPKVLKPSSYHEKALELVNWLLKDIKFDIYRDYLQVTLGNGKRRSMFVTSMKGLINVFKLVSTVVFNSAFMFMIYFVMKYNKPVNDLISKRMIWISVWKFSVLIPAIIAFYLIPDTLEFWNTIGEAEEHIRYSKTWHRDFLRHHTSWIDDKTAQFQCIVDQYWDGLEKFRHMSGPFFVYRQTLMATAGIIGQYNLEQFLQIYHNHLDSVDVKSDDVFYTAYRMMNNVHLKINKSVPWGPDERVHEFRNMFNDYFERILRVPEQNHFFVMKVMVFAMSFYTCVLSFGIAFSPFMDEIAVKKVVVKVFDWGQNAIMVFVIIKAVIFTYLVTQVVGAQAVQEALLDVNMEYLNGLKSTNGLELGSLFGEAQNPNKTLIEMYFKEQFIFDARPELFVSNVTNEDFEFLDWMFPMNETMWARFPAEYDNKTVSQMVNIRKLYRGIAQNLEFDTDEHKSQFTGVFFGINYNRHAQSILKHVLVAVNAPVWSLPLMPVYHSILAFWMLFAIPHIKETMEVIYQY